MCWLYARGLYDRHLRYRTRLCKYRMEIGRCGLCPYGQSCQYAHSKHEMREMDDPRNVDGAYHAMFVYLYGCGYTNDE